MSATVTLKIPKLGFKGAMPTAKQKNPRKANKVLTESEKYEAAFYDFVAMNSGNVDVAKTIIEGFHLHKKDPDYQDTILQYWIGVPRMAERKARILFGVGGHRYHRHKILEKKKKGGGMKSNWVS